MLYGVKHIGSIVLLLMVVILPAFTNAQTGSANKHGVNKKHSQAGQKKGLTPEEIKKAAVRRTLKEKNFHLPDTSKKCQKTK